MLNQARVNKIIFKEYNLDSQTRNESCPVYLTYHKHKKVLLQFIIFILENTANRAL